MDLEDRIYLQDQDNVIVGTITRKRETVAEFQIIWQLRKNRSWSSIITIGFILSQEKYILLLIRLTFGSSYDIIYMHI